MPQLNPGPWLTTFLITWLAYLVVFFMKTQTTTFLNSPISLHNEEHKINSWTWPWP